MLEGQFEPATDGVAFDELMPLDKLMLARLTQVQAEVDEAYAGYEFNRAYRTLYDFVVTELSNVYLDALKDRLYCEKPGSHEMRSAQTVVAELLSMLMRDLQPILSYTVDEAMEFAPAGCRDNQEYAALLDWYKSPITLEQANEFAGVLEASLELRGVVTKAIEEARSAGTFTKSQQVRVKLPPRPRPMRCSPATRLSTSPSSTSSPRWSWPRVRRSPPRSRPPMVRRATAAGTTVPLRASTASTSTSATAALRR